MSAIITKDLRAHNARQFVEGLYEPANTVMYMFIGKSDDWPDENNPTTPVDTQNSQADIWNNMIALKRIHTGDATHVRPRVNWTNNTVYSQYDSTLDSANLFAGSFVVMNSSYQVYKCLRNNYGVASTVQPTGTGLTGNNIVKTADGYTWKYMYSLDTANILTFMTTTFIPVLPDASVATDAANTTGIFNYKILQANIGSGSIADSTTITIAGNGSGATANIRVTAGNITSVNALTPGINYTVANVTTNLGNAIIEPMIAPFGGHGADPIGELGAYYVMVNNKLEQTDSDIPIEGVEFRQIGIVREPRLYNTTTIADTDTLKAYKGLTILGSITNSGSLVAGATIRGQTSGANATVVNFTGNTINYVQTKNSSPNVQANFTAFQSGELVSVGVNSIGTINALVNPTVAPGKGEIIYIDNRKVISRAPDQVESLYIVLEF